jgi:hypothetical protein
MLLFGKRGAMQCGLSERRQWRNTGKSRKIKRHERNAPLKRVLKVEGVGEESEKSCWV